MKTYERNHRKWDGDYWYYRVALVRWPGPWEWEGNDLSCFHGWSGLEHKINSLERPQEGWVGIKMTKRLGPESRVHTYIVTLRRRLSLLCTLQSRGKKEATRTKICKIFCNLYLVISLMKPDGREPLNTLRIDKKEKRWSRPSVWLLATPSRLFVQPSL